MKNATIRDKSLEGKMHVAVYFGVRLGDGALD
jgi:hypothetical protein